MTRRILDDEDSGGGVGTGGGTPTLLRPKWLTATWTHAETNPSAAHKGFRVVFFTGTDPNDTAQYVVAPIEVGPAERGVVQVVKVLASVGIKSAVQAIYHNGDESSWRVNGGAVVVDPDTVAVGTQAAVIAAQTTGNTAITNAAAAQTTANTAVSNAAAAESTANAAVQAAATAQAAADGKIDSFFQPTAPTSASEGDLWFDTDDGNKIYTRRSGAWVVTQDSQIGAAIAAAGTAQGTADGKARIYYQAAQPLGLGATDQGDLWVDTDDGMKLWAWTGSAWVLAQDWQAANAAAGNALTAANTAQSTANSAISNAAAAQATASAANSTAVTAAANAPLVVNGLPALPDATYPASKLVYDSVTKKLYRSTGSAWEASTVASADIAGAIADSQISGLDASKLAGTLAAARVAVGSLDAKISAIASSQITGLDAAKLAGTLDAARIAVGSLDAKISSISNAQLGTGIDITKLAGTLDAARVAVGSLDAKISAIASSQITGLDASKLAGTLDVARIADDALTASKIASIPTTKLTGTILANQIAANQIQAQHLLLSSQGFCLNQDPLCADITAWTPNANLTVALFLDLPAGGTGLVSAAGVDAQFSCLDYIPVEQSKNYRLNILARSFTGTPASNYLGIIWCDANKAVLDSSVAQPTGAGNPTGWSNGSYSYYGLMAMPTPATWTDYECSFGPDETRKIPTNAKFMRIVILANYSFTAGARAAFSGIRLTEKVNASLIVDGAITAAKIAANSITANQIAASAIGAEELAANAVIAGKIAAGTIVANDIAAGAVTAAKIAAGSITSDKIFVTGRGKALNDDPNCQDPSAWQYPGTVSFLSDPNLPMGTEKIRCTDATAWLGSARFIPIEGGKRYKVSCWAKQYSGTGVFYLRLYCYSADSTLISYQVTAVAPATGTLEGVTIPNAWTHYTGYIDAPSNSCKAHFAMYVNWPTTGLTDICDVRVEEFIPGDLIVDGAIKTNHMTANSINADRLAARSISAGLIATDSITSNEMAANSVTASEIAAGSIFASHMTLSNFQNLIPNGNSEGNVTGAPAGTFETVALLVAGGVSRSGANCRSWIGNGGGSYTEVPCSPGDKFLLELWGLVSLASESCWAYIGFRDAAGTVHYDDYQWQALNWSTWTKFTVVATAPAGAKSVAVHVNGTAGGHRYYIDDMSLRRMADAELIVDGAIIAAKIAAGAVVAGKIAAGTIVAADIASDAITASKIAAGAITTSKLAVIGGFSGCINVDPQLQDPTAWLAEVGTVSFQTVSDAPIGNTVIRSGANANCYLKDSCYYPVDITKTYRLRFWTRGTAGANGGIHYQDLQQFLDNQGNTCSTNGGRAPYKPSGVTIPAAWTEYSNTWGPGDWQTGVKFVKLDWLMNYNSATGYQEICNVRFEEMVSAELVVDGSIIASKVAAEAITSDKMAANSITGDRILANSLDASKITSDSITAGQIAAGAIGADEIAANAIHAKHLTVANFDNLMPNPNSEPLSPQGTAWPSGAIEAAGLLAGNGANGIYNPTSNGGARWLAGNASAAAYLAVTPFISCKPGDSFFLTCKALTMNAAASAHLVIEFYDQATSAITDVFSNYTADGILNLTALAPTTVSNGQPPVKFKVYLGVSAAAGDNRGIFNWFYLRRMAEGSLIVDGSIIAVKIAANTITADQLATDLATANIIRSANWNGSSAQSTTGYKISGTVFNAYDATGTPKPVQADFASNTMMGGYLVGGLTARAMSAIGDNGLFSTSFRCFYRGNNDGATLAGAPNIARFFVQSAWQQTSAARFCLNFFLRPTAYTDNFDGMRYAKIDFYRGNTTSATKIMTQYVVLPDRAYFSATDTNANNQGCASLYFENDTASGILSGNNPRWFLFITLYNASGPSASAWFAPPSALNTDWIQSIAAPYSGGGSGGGGGGGTGGGNCPAPDVPLLMADGTEKPAGEIRVGDLVIAWDEVAGREVIEAVTHAELAENERWSLTLDNGRTGKFAANHRFLMANGEWRELQTLRAGDQLSTGARVDSAFPEAWGPVVQITVARVHTYFTLGAVSHNLKILNP